MPSPALATQPPPVHLQLHICEHRAGPDQLRSRLIRRDRFLDRNNAEAYFDLVHSRLQPGELVLLRLGDTNLRLARHPDTAQD